jgi:hypothetical protein
MIRAIIIALALVIATTADAKPIKKRHDANGNPITRRCDPPKRWLEVNALASDAGRPSKRVCR